LEGQDISVLRPLFKDLQEYYKNLAARGQKDGSVTGPVRIANAFKRLGKLCRQMGDLAGASEALNKGEELYRHASARRPGRAVRLDHARLLTERGQLLRELGQFQQAEDDYRTGLGILDGLLAEDKASLDYLRAKAELLHWKGALLGGRGRLDRAPAAA